MAGSRGFGDGKVTTVKLPLALPRRDGAASVYDIAGCEIHIREGESNALAADAFFVRFISSNSVSA
jgi:hypothetical protein